MGVNLRSGPFSTPLTCYIVFSGVGMIVNERDAYYNVPFSRCLEVVVVVIIIEIKNKVNDSRTPQKRTYPPPPATDSMCMPSRTKRIVSAKRRRVTTVLPSTKHYTTYTTE